MVNRRIQFLILFIDGGRADYAILLKGFKKHENTLLEIKDSKDESNEDNPTWNNEYLPGLDIVALYSMISEFKPKNYIEVGSGNSTKVA